MGASARSPWRSLSRRRLLCLRREGKISVPTEISGGLIRMSRATIDRLLAKHRQGAGGGAARLSRERYCGPRSPFTPSPTGLSPAPDSSRSIGLRTAATQRPGSSSILCRLPMNQQTGSGRPRCKLQSPECGRDSGGGARPALVSLAGNRFGQCSTFRNGAVEGHYDKNEITFARCRLYKKNHQAHVEQKNWAAVQ